MNARGLSLIECLLAVSVLAILIMAAVPLQSTHWHQSQRAMARTALAQASWTIEREALWRGNYEVSEPDWHAITQGLSYRLTLSQESAGYVLRAIPQGRQASDLCGTLWLNQRGQKGADGDLSACW